MAMKAKRIQISDDLEREITRECEMRGRPWSVIVRELLDEAIRIRRVPGIAFMDGGAGRRAVIAGTGLGVWEIIGTWRDAGGNFEELRQNFDWLTERQLHDALAYYARYPVEIDARLEREEQLTPERIWQEYPFLKPLR